MRDTETKFGGEVRAVLARHRVLEFASLEMIRALPREDAARLAHELRTCVNNQAPALQDPLQVVIREWSFLKRPSTAEGSAAAACGPPNVVEASGAETPDQGTSAADSAPSSCITISRIRPKALAVAQGSAVERLL